MPRTVSNPGPDQASRLRELARQDLRPSTLRTIAVFSGKGGVGKTNLAVNLAILLGARGARVMLLDLDFGLANADLLLNVTSGHNLSRVLDGTLPLAQASQTVSAGVRFVPGAPGGGRDPDLSPEQLSRLLAQMGNLENQCDLAVLDCGAGLSNTVLELGLSSHLGLLVTTPEPTAMADAYAVIKALTHRGREPESIRLVVNQASTRREAQHVFERVGSVARNFLQFTVADGGYLLHDTHVELAVRQRCPFVLRHPRCAASACVAAIADGLMAVNGTPWQHRVCVDRTVGTLA